MQASILCTNCKKAILKVDLLGQYDEFATRCPVCGPISGFVIVSFRDFGADARVTTIADRFLN